MRVLKKTPYTLERLFIITMGYTPCCSNHRQYIVLLIVLPFILLLVRYTQNEKPAYNFYLFFQYILIRENHYPRKALYI